MNSFARVQTLPAAVPTEEMVRRQLQLKCPVCSREMNDFDAMDISHPATCSACCFTVSNQEGIWRALAPDREERFHQFIQEYQKVREIEGRGSSNPDFYLRLPYEDTTGRNEWQWKIRSRSFRFLEAKILPAIESGHKRGLDVLDLGAGNCWMSFRLALRGHRPVSVDLIDNAEDGLGAGRHYLSHLVNPFVRFQAEMDRLPFEAHQFDLAIFNASFHYSENYRRTLAEAIRCLRRPGHVLIVDSPFYSREESGRQMVRERQGQFERRFGFPSDSIPSREYLTQDALDDLARTLGLKWEMLRPWYGLGWALRPLKARLLLRREPAKFLILWARITEA